MLEEFNEKDIVDGCYIVPNDVVEIGARAFCYHRNFKKVIIPSSVKKIGNNAFKACYDLEEVELNDGLIEIGDQAFSRTSIKTIKIPESVEDIGEYCFLNCGKLISLELPKNIKYLGRALFENCDLLKKVNLPENIEILPHSFFRYCTSLKNVKLPHGLKKIESMAFRECSSLKQIIFPETVSDIEASAFYNCLSLTNVVWPPKLKVLKYYTFGNCCSLEKIRLPENLEAIEENAFSDCKLLHKIKFPASLKTIAYNAFSHTPLKKVIINDKEIGLTRVQANRFGCFYPFFNYATKNNCFIPKTNEIIYKTKDEEIENFYKYSKDWKKILDRYLELQKEYAEHNCLNINSGEVTANLYQVCVVLGLFQNLTKQKRKELNDFIEKNILPINPEDLHRLYSGLETEVYGYNKEFAEFYIKNYQQPMYDKEGNVLYFMEEVESYYDDEDDYDRYYDGEDEEDETDLDDEVVDEEICFDPEEVEIIDYVEQAYNNWEQVKEVFPNKTVLNHREHASENNNLTVDDIIHALNNTEYDNIHEGNEDMAEIVGYYGYDQEDFERLQSWWDLGKKITPEDKSLKLSADNESYKISYELMRNDDEEILILGEKTNCCQTVNDAGSECVKYGVMKPNSGFIKFSYNGRIIGQSWVWHNKRTKTVCLDNIEIPTLWKKKIKKHKSLEQDFLDCLHRLADSFVKNMNIDRVTIGAGYNDLSVVTNLDIITGNISPTPDDYHGYTDAEITQFILYDKTLNKNRGVTKTEDGNISFEIGSINEATF